MESEVYHKLANIEDDHWWWRARRRIIENILLRLHFRPNADIFEVGCGSGGNLQMLCRFGKVCGMELEEIARQYAIRRGLAEILPGRLPDDIPFNGRRFDLVLLIDVLEHLDDDVGSLKRLREYVNDDGWLLLTVPAFQFLWSKHDDSHHHKRRYIKSNLADVVARAGFNVKFISYYNMLLFPVIAGIRKYKNIFGGGDDLSIPSKPVNASLERIFGFERHLLGRMPFPFGVSLILAAQRSPP